MDEFSISSPMPLNKLRGVTQFQRRALKRLRITTTAQLFRAVHTAEGLCDLAERSQVREEELVSIIHRADMARVNGVGAVFGDMLIMLDVVSLRQLMDQDPADLHARLSALNQQERLARRSPTPEEVESWIDQAKSLPPATKWT
ncbi:MAG: DUF4332 domain-containing protein [Geminicoccaceae bacterium]